MKSRNHRKSRQRARPSRWTVKAVIVFLGIGAAASGFLWQKSQLRDLGRTLHAKEQDLYELKEKSTSLRQQLYALSSNHALAKRIEALGLDLVPTRPDQIVWVSVPAFDPEVKETQASASRRPRANRESARLAKNQVGR